MFRVTHDDCTSDAGQYYNKCVKSPSSLNCVITMELCYCRVSKKNNHCANIIWQMSIITKEDKQSNQNNYTK